MKTGTCQRPPLQWPQEVLAAAVCFPYIVTLQLQALSVYSMVDLQHKQTVNLRGARGLLSTSGRPGSRKSPSLAVKLQYCLRKEDVAVPVCTNSVNHSGIWAFLKKPKQNLPSDGVLVYTERDIFSLRLVPFHEQIQALVQDERFEEASLLLDGVQARCPLDSHKVKCNFEIQTAQDANTSAF